MNPNFYTQWRSNPMIANLQQSPNVANYSAIPTAQDMAIETQPYQASLTDRLGNAWDSATSEGGFLTMDSMFGDGKSTGWVNPTLKGVGSVMGGWNAMQQLDLAKDAFNFQKDAYNTNLANQTQLTNQAMIDRQRARHSANPNMAAPDEEWKRTNLLPQR
ncbi:hypothetical protein [Photobacterium leiognathi]|uniref:hypothetical protein n=1 Tax=Photobacterium leiognathi TaxID=553611 RepID=UPI002980F69A|nr:hypothetical protein [Photobacterium leiognathi]